MGFFERFRKGAVSHRLTREQIDRLPFPQRLAALNALASREDPRCVIFGANKHRYRFQPVATAQEVAQVQATLGVSFPDSYLQYLTKLGNGGAGPDYGIYSLDEMQRHSQHLLHQPLLGEPVLHPDMTLEEWREITSGFEDAAESDEYDAFFGWLLQGALVLGTQGCAEDTLLMCSGEHAGEVVYFNWEIEADFSVPYFTGMQFDEWMSGYYEKLLGGGIEKYRPTFWNVRW